MSTPYAFIGRLEAIPDQADALEQLLSGALPLAQSRLLNPSVARLGPTLRSVSSREWSRHGSVTPEPAV